METAKLSDRLFDEREMEKCARKFCEDRHLDQTVRALDFAIEKHTGQFRKPGHVGERVPYISHPLLVTCHAIALGLEEDDLLSACLLHDVCEDCDVAVEELPVSDETRKAVGLLTKPEDFDNSDRMETEYYDRIAENRIAAMVKLLDRCNNVSMMGTSFPDSHLEDYILETKRYVYPLLDKAIKEYKGDSCQLFLIKYHMTSVVESLHHRLIYGGA